MAGILYLCATPIGNLEDMTPRAQRMLAEADVIAAEDTRHTLQLLNRFNIKGRLVRYDEHSKERQGAYLLDELLSGKNIALVSDAGFPGIADPGEQLARLAIDAGVQVINGTASFLDGKTIEVKGAHDTVQILSASKFIINTGARPMIPAVPGVENNRFVFTSETMMDNETLPRRLTIIGGGYIGLEFASMYARFGSKVTILQNGSVFLPKEDRDMAEAVENVLKSYGVFVITGAGLKEIKEGTAVYTKNGEEDTLDGDAILLATGPVSYTHLTLPTKLEV